MTGGVARARASALGNCDRLAVIGRQADTGALRRYNYSSSPTTTANY